MRCEVHGSNSLCAYHHPDLTSLPAPLPQLGREQMNEEIDDFETEWLLDMDKSGQQVYWQTLTPTPESIVFYLQSTTVCGDLVLDLALLMTMATGTLTDNQTHLECMNEFIGNIWLKKRSANSTTRGDT